MSHTTLRAALALHRAAQTWATRALDRATNSNRGDRGAGFVEYAGLMILIAGIFTLIDGLALDSKISSAIGTAVSNVISGG
ncbi:hypothetical protein MA546_06685 [Streptomyces sp. T7(2022)]|uniref:hypothetical protein n=1 Tax=Streptomyces sp. T7(2022) TaxID=2916034 RepID=UPI001EE43933|nr:hypothetical protein [Streptomyces sp. T7(2022)]MCG5118462.1 hypothetical protein [Streptomyces sp. T7(2022)]